MMRRTGLFFLTLLCLTVTLFSCRTNKNVYYTKEIIDSNKVVVIQQIDIPVPLIQPYDILQITFYGKGFDMTTMLNNFGGLETAQKNPSSVSEALKGGYLVSPDGFIELPQLGKIKVESLTLKQLRADLTERASKIMVEPTVLVKFSAFKVTMIGEVTTKGIITSQNEKLSILEALGLSGDITLYGLKDKVKVFRTQDSTTIGTIDLTSRDMFKSEYFYLKPNDVVYVPSDGQQQQQQKVNTLLPFVTLGIAVLSIIITVFR